MYHFVVETIRFNLQRGELNLYFSRPKLGKRIKMDSKEKIG